MAYMKTLTVNGVTYTVDDPDSVSYGMQQELTQEQKQTARENIGAVDEEQAAEIASAATKPLNPCIGKSVMIAAETDGDPVRIVTVLNETEDPVRTIYVKRSMMGKPLFGGAALRDAVVEESAGVADLVAGTVTFSGKNAQGDRYYVIPESERVQGKQYTFIFYGRTATTANTSLNMRFTYTDGSYDLFRAAAAGKVGYAAFVSNPKKTLEAVTGMYNTSADIIVYYELCGLFEGVHTAEEYKVLTATFEQGVSSGVYNWNTGLLTSGDHTEQLAPQEMALLAGENEIYSNDGVNHVTQVYATHIDSGLTKYGQAADAGATGARFGYTPQGYSASYDITRGPGWYRAAILIRSASGLVEMSMTQNKPAVGRFGQHLMFGFTGFADIASAGHDSTEDYPRDENAHPHIFQIANHTYGEDLAIAEENGRAIRVDAVRISYPKMWEGQEDETGEYKNPINIYLDFHVTGPNSDWAAAKINPRFELNLSAHTYNNRCAPIDQERPCKVDQNGNVLGEFNDVACDTYEFSLIDNHGFYVQDPSYFESVAVKRVTVENKDLAAQVILEAAEKEEGDAEGQGSYSVAELRGNEGNGEVILRNVAPGQRSADAVNVEQMWEAISASVCDVFLVWDEYNAGDTKLTCSARYDELRVELYDRSSMVAFLDWRTDSKKHQALTSTIHLTEEYGDIIFDFAGLGIARLNKNDELRWEDNDSVTQAQMDANTKDTIDKICPAFSKSGTVVACEPVEGYPLDVAATGWGSKNYLEGFDINQLDRQNLYVLNLQPGDYRISVEYDEEGADGDAGQWLALNVSGDSGASWEISEMVYDYDNGIHQEVAFTVTGAEDEQWALQSGEGFYYITSLMLNKAPSQITRCGKNLARPRTQVNQNSYGLTSTLDGDAIVINGTSTMATNNIYLLSDVTYPGGVYTISNTPTVQPGKYVVKTELVSGTLSGCTTVIGAQPTAGTTQYYYVAIGKTATFDFSQTTRLSVIAQFSNGGTAENARVCVQIEVGPTATDFEPYCGETFAPGDTIPALPGVNTIYADAGTVTVTGRANPVPIINSVLDRLAAVEAAIVNNT